MEIERNHYLVRLSSLEDTVSTLYMDDVEYATITKALKYINNNSFHVEGTFTSRISYCEIPFPSMQSAVDYYNANKDYIHWIDGIF